MRDVNEEWEELMRQLVEQTEPGRVTLPARAVGREIRGIDDILREGSGYGIDLREGVMNVEEVKVSHFPLENVKQGLPILGMRVTLCPDKFAQSYSWRSRIGKPATVINLLGDEYSAQRVVHRYKKGSSQDSWNVRIRFDDGKEVDQSINVLIAHHEYDNEPLVIVKFQNGEVLTCNKEKLNEKLDEYVFQYGYRVDEKFIQSKEYVQEMLDKA